MRSAVQINQPKVIAFTKEGLAELSVKESRLLARREVVIVELQRAREQGDLSENGAYKAARFELGQTDRELRHLHYLMKYGKVVEPPLDGTIGVGSVVNLIKEDGVKVTYKMVGTYEADPLNGKISLESPMGSALAGKKTGESVVVAGKPYKVSP